jgi:hypothetical protein
MKLKHLIFLLIAILLLSFSFALIYHSFFVIDHIESAPYSFSVRNKIGLVGDQDAIKFGGIHPGGKGTRSMYFDNIYDKPVKIRFNIKGEKSDWIQVQENNFWLQPGETREIEITVFVPGFADYHENYTGVVKAYYLWR